MTLEAKQVSYRYATGRWIFQDLSLSATTGERVGILGPSGYGKTTLSRLLAGYDKPAQGAILFQGAPLPTKGFCPVQLAYQHPEKALNPRWKMGRSLTEYWTPPQDLMDAFGIQEKWLSRYPNELSGGELQRFCLLRILAPELKFLIADEISTMLDPITQAQIWGALLQLAQERELGMLIITHNQALADRVCTRTLYLPDMVGVRVASEL